MIQSNDALSAARIRENQRRSRNRRAELLRSLQNRVQEYEQKGIAATVEMQQAARKVMHDNVRLRALLALRGVSNEEVEAFLQSSNDPSPLEANPAPSEEPFTACQYPVSENADNHSFGNEESSQSTRNRSVDQGHPRADSRLVQGTAEYHSIPNPDVTRPLSSDSQTKSLASETRPGCEEMQSHLESNFPRPIVGPPECVNSLECFCPPTLTKEHDTANPSLEISCEAAATIIVEMRGDQDHESVRASLGCRGQETCTIKNSIVMQILDEG